MYLNQFSIRVPEGHERTSGYVEMEHCKQYTLVLRNDHDMRCDAEVSIDGKTIGTFRIAARSNIRLERKPDDDGRFTFYRMGSSEAERAELGNVSASDLGLIRVIFTPEEQWTTTHAGSGVIVAWTAGGTGLSGHSNQSFRTVGDICYDYSRQTTIHLRLVAARNDEPRPLCSTMTSNPIPPPVNGGP